MDYNRDKLEALEDKLDAYLAALDSARESRRLAELSVAAATATIFRAATTMKGSPVDPPSRFQSSGGGSFLAEFNSDPERVLALFRKEAPKHPMTGLLEGHSEAVMALDRVNRKFDIAQARVNALAPVVANLREFVRRAA